VRPLARVREPAPAARSGLLPTVRAPVAPVPGLVPPAGSAVGSSSRPVSPLGGVLALTATLRRTPIAPELLLRPSPRLLAVRRAPVATGTLVPTAALVPAVRPRPPLTTGTVIATAALVPAVHPRAPLATGTLVPTAPLVSTIRPRATLAPCAVVAHTAAVSGSSPAVRSALAVRAALAARTIVAPARAVLPTPGAALAAAVVTATAEVAPRSIPAARATINALAVAPTRLGARVALPAAATGRLAVVPVVPLPPLRPLSAEPALAAIPIRAAATTSIPLFLRSPVASTVLTTVLALPPEPAAVAPALAIAVAARIAITVPAGSDSWRARPAAALVALSASRRTPAGAGIPIIVFPAAVAIFSRAVIAGTIRDTHL
jgi:hypothetical protein